MKNLIKQNKLSNQNQNLIYGYEGMRDHACVYGFGDGSRCELQLCYVCYPACGS